MFAKKRKLIYLCVLLLILVLAYIYIKKFMVGTKLWGYLSEHELIEIKDINSVEKYNNNYEALFYGATSGNFQMASFRSGCDYNELFGDDLSFIFSGTVIQCDNYVFSAMLDETKVDNPKKLDFACHTVKIHVDKDIYGNLKENQDVYLFCRWLYDLGEETDKDNQLAEGKNGVFTTSGRPVMLEKEHGGSIFTIGSLHKLSNKYMNAFHYRLTDNTDGLDNLETKQDVIDFWEKQHWVFH